MNFRIEFRVQNNEDNAWSGIFGYKPVESDEIDFFSVIKLKANLDRENLEMIGKMLFEEIQVAFFDDGNPETNLVLRLESASLKMKSKMDLILSREDEVKNSGLDIEMAIGVIFQNYMYLGVIGESKIYISRSGEVTEIADVLEDGDMNNFLRSGSLALENDDRILMSTSSISKYEDKIENTLQDLSLSYFNDEVLSSYSLLVIADESLEWNKIPEENIRVEENGDLLEDKESELINIDVLVEDSNLDKKIAPPIIDKLKEKFTNIKNKVVQNIKSKKRGENKNEPIQDEVKFSEIIEENQEEPAGKNSKLVLTTMKIKSGIGSVSSKASMKWNSEYKDMTLSLRDKFISFLKVILEKLKILLDKLIQWFRREFIGSNDRRDRMVRGKTIGRNRKILIVVVVVLIVVLVIGINQAENNRREQEKISGAEKAVTQLESRFTTLNNKVPQVQSGNSESKVSLINDFSKLVSDIENQKKVQLFQDELESLNSRIQQSRDNLLGIESFTQPAILSDVGKQFADANLSDMVYLNGSLFVSDSARNVVYKINPSNLDTKAEVYLTGLIQPYLLTPDGNGNIVFYDNDTTSAIGRFGTTQPNLTRFGQLSLSNIGKPVEVAIFDNNKALYELKSTNRQIFKRDKIGETYINGGASISTDQNTNWRTDQDYGNGIDISVPFEAYVLISGQGVKRYLSRGENNLTFESFNNLLRTDYDSMQKASSFDVTLKYMAISDPINRRVMILQIQDDVNKTISFIKQFVYRGEENIFKDLREVVINESDRAIFVLDGSKIIRLQF